MRRPIHAAMFTRPEVPKQAWIAFSLLLFGAIWSNAARLAPGRPAMDWSSGYSIGYNVIGPMLPWITATVLAIASIVRFRGSARLWPGYTTLVVIVLCFLTAIPTAHQNGRLSAVRQDANVIAHELAARERTFTAIGTSCAQRVGARCTAAELLATPGAVQAGLEPGTRCRRSGAICVSDGVDHALRIEQVTRPVKEVGPIRVESTIAASGSVSISCVALRDAARPAYVKAACGLGDTNSMTIPAPSS